jgi:hypothetical protein
VRRRIGGRSQDVVPEGPKPMQTRPDVGQDLDLDVAVG